MNCKLVLLSPVFSGNQLCEDGVGIQHFRLSPSSGVDVMNEAATSIHTHRVGQVWLVVCSGIVETITLTRDDEDSL
jgi:hypothetical protein